MKKLTALLLSVGMVFTLAACGGSKVSDDALTKLETSIKNIADMKSADYAIEITAKDAENADVKMKLSGSYIFETAIPQISMSLDMESGTEKVDGYMQMYLKDSVAYLNLMDISKSKQTIEGLDESVASFGLDKDTLTLPKDEIKKYLKEASVKDDVLTLVFDTEKVMAATKSADAEISDLVGEESKIDALTMTVTLKDDMLSKAEIIAKVTQKVDGKDKSAETKITVSFANINDVKQIQFPSFDDYVESSETDGLLG